MNRRPPRSALVPYAPLFRPLSEELQPQVLLDGMGGELRRVVARAAGVRLDPRRRADDHDVPVAGAPDLGQERLRHQSEDRKSTRLNSSHANISYAVFCLKKK